MMTMIQQVENIKKIEIKKMKIMELKNTLAEMKIH